MRRVAITGVGAICALGNTAGEFAVSLRQGRCGIGPIESADCSSMRFRNGAEVKYYSHQPYFYSDLFDLGYEAVGELDSGLDIVEDWKEPFRKQACLPSGNARDQKQKFDELVELFSRYGK